MKKILKYSIIFGFSLPILFNVVGLFIDLKMLDYMKAYPVSFIFEQILDGIMTAIPYLMLLLFYKIFYFKRKSGDKYYIQNKVALLITDLIFVVITALSCTIIFLSNYLGFKNILWKQIAGNLLFPVHSALLVLVMYGIGFVLGWLINRYKIKK